MTTRGQNWRRLGQILLDGGFLTSNDLGKALAEQQHTNELLGQILARMGVVDPVEIKAALSVQEHIGNLEESIRSAAGTSQMLGSLLIMAGRITHEQLEYAISVQKITGEKLGEVFTRLGILKGEQLNCLLAYQHNQSSGTRHANPFRLGEILVTTGYITRTQLEDALLKQNTCSKKLGVVLVEVGYAASHQVKHGICLQQRLVTAALAAILAISELALSGCGGGGGTDAPVTTPPATTAYNTGQPAKTGYLTVTSDDYTLVTPTYYYSTANESFWSIQANIARYVQDIDTRCVIRIDVPRINGSWPRLNKVFSIEDSLQHEKFPGAILVFNGNPSIMSKVEHGIISFDPDSVTSEHVSGYFEVTLTDHGSSSLPRPEHHLKGVFNFKMGEHGPATTLMAQNPVNAP